MIIATNVLYSSRQTPISSLKIVGIFSGGCESNPYWPSFCHIWSIVNLRRVD